MKARFITWIDVAIWCALVFIVVSSLFGLTGCGKARDNAYKLLGEGTRCVQRSEHIAYCIDKQERGFVCDDETCVPACGAVMPVLERGDGKNEQ